MFNNEKCFVVYQSRKVVSIRQEGITHTEASIIEDFQQAPWNNF